MREIILTGKHGEGKVALVDDEDYGVVNNRRWRVNTQGYAMLTPGSKYSGSIPYRNGDGYKYVCNMERFILQECLGVDIPSGMLIDHIDGNPLNNQEDNLRLVTSWDNWKNRGKMSSLGSRYQTITSQYIGVSFASNSTTKTWMSRARIDGVLVYLGYYETEEEAARARDDYVFEQRGELARLNFPRE
jgi:hypothetical protein